MARPAKPDDQKLITASTKLKPQTVKEIERIAVVEGLDVSKIVRRMIEEGMEHYEQTLHRGGQLSAQLLSRFRLLTRARQYDLLAISEALLSRQEFDETTHVQPQPDATLGIPYGRFVVDGLQFRHARHTLATELLRAGRPIHAVGQRLGHDPKTMLRHYAGVNAADDVQDIEALEQIEARRSGKMNA